MNEFKLNQLVQKPDGTVGVIDSISEQDTGQLLYRINDEWYTYDALLPATAMQQVIQWQKDAGNSNPDKKRASLLVGCIFEEIGEFLEAEDLLRTHAGQAISVFERFYKDTVPNFINQNEILAKKPEIIDALTDIIVFAMAATMALGEDPEQCLKAVADSNDTKRMPDGSFLRNEQGKIMKPEHYKQPDWSFLK
jgi:predicted HAD superfamily Cof-like phosphohydrolase